MSTDQTLFHWLHVLENLLPSLSIGLASVLLVAAVTVAILNLLDIRRLLKQKSVFLELTPPGQTDKTPDANQRLFSVLHGMEGSRSLLDKLLRHKVTFSIETVSTREQGIRYIWRVPEAQVEIFEQTIAAHMAETKFKRVDDFLPNVMDFRKVRVLSFRQTGYFAYPLQTQFTLEQHDPAAYINGAMTQLKPEELMAFQIVVSPAEVREATILQHKLAHNEALVTQLGNRRLPVSKLFSGINTILFGIIDAIGDIHHGPSRSGSQSQKAMNHKQEVATRVKPARTLSSLEGELAKSVNQKLQQPLFRADIRAIVITDDSQRRKQRVSGLRNALDSFKVPKYQGLKARFAFPMWVRGRYRLFALRHRLPSVFSRNTAILSTSEVADIYHFPHSVTARTEGVNRSQNTVLPVPSVIKKRGDNQEFDVLLGKNIHHGEVTDIGLLAKEREKHMYIIGGTGNGKTTFMEYCAVQDIRNGKGVALIDPHGDSAKKILKYIPQERIKDVIYLNPIDIKHPIGLNLLELPIGLDEDALLLEKGRVTSAVVSVMRKVFSDDESNAHRIEAIMRNAVHTALTVEGATLFTVLKLPRNGKFRKEVVSRLDDEDLKDFWREEIGQAGDMQMVSMTKGVTQRIDRFNISAPAKRMIGQSKSTISFEDIMDSGKILICNLGDLEEDETSLFGTTVLAKLKMAAERRARMPEDERRPFYVYVDEFQNFATTPFVKMLSSSRKYKFFLTIAEQSTKQQDDDRLTEAILSNVSTVVCFRTGSHADEELMLHRFEPFIKQGDISNLPSYNFYLRIQAQESLEPMSGQTVVLPAKEAREDMGAAVVKASREAYATTYVKPTNTEKLKEKPSEDKGLGGKRGKGSRKRDDNSEKSNDALDSNDDR